MKPTKINKFMRKSDTILQTSQHLTHVKDKDLRELTNLFEHNYVKIF